ncbi:GntG family PLP-dependent aldolase [Anaeroselena agilis]|uniref:GntG family PLP-dependent aldolase n=1 Tax=Anaeroselena agilis TaxID=3063788 RepID=A0ABU3NW25_9FIRM|nr:GntG family PLP-dependent aldolase [Selenomonadales bacterium 4137-cl]
MRTVDLRSDTVTMPTEEMRQAMFRAEVGDDVYREDPTVMALEELGAAMMGKEAGLFLTSGTMGNQVAAMAHTKKSDEIICEMESHIYYYEVAGLACLAGAQVRPVIGDRGVMTAAAIRGAIRPIDIHAPETALICVENTHNRAGGTCYPLGELAAIRRLADEFHIPVHMDGARIFNAAVAQGVAVAEIAQHADTVQFCLSKGLAAPVGSLLVGTRPYIEKARRFRKMLGGGMRQAGIVAAAGIVALKTMVDRLAEDHTNARLLGEAIAASGYVIDMSTVQTNIVIFSTDGLKTDAPAFVAMLKDRGIKANAFGERRVRMVTHFGVDRADIDYTVDVLAKLKQECS